MKFFAGGFAIGSVSSRTADDLAAGLGAWGVQVTDGSTFLTDARLVNRGGVSAAVEFSYWSESTNRQLKWPTCGSVNCALVTFYPTVDHLSILVLRVAVS